MNPRFHRWAMTDPTLAAALADYALATSSRAADWPIDLYVRKDEIGLRRSLPEPGERPRLSRAAQVRCGGATGRRGATTRLSTPLAFYGRRKESFTDVA